MKRRCRLTVPHQGSGMNLTEFLAGRFSYFRRREWEGEIKCGRILLNGRSALSSDLLQSGDRITYTPSQLREPPVDRDFDILFEDEAILAVHKPANLPCHPGGRYFRHTLWAMLKERRPEATPHFVHRLDRETSGVVLIAKHAGDAARLGRQMAAGGFHKAYAALVEGRFPEAPLSADGVIAPDQASVIRKKMRFFPLDSRKPPPAGAKPCCTRFERLQEGPAVSLISAAPATGRGHQIRATLLAMGYPVVGDKIYGVDETLFLRFIDDRLTGRDRSRLRMERQALHAASLAFDHPRTGRRISIEAPVPPVFGRCLAELP